MSGDIKTLNRYHNYLNPYIGYFLLAIGFTIITTILGLVTPLLVKVLFDYAYPLQDLYLLNLSVIAIVCVYFASFFLGVLADYLEIYINQGASAKLTNETFFAAQCLPLSFLQSKRSGDLLIRITDDVSNSMSMATALLPTIIIEGGKFLIILAIAFSLSPQLTLLALGAIPLYILETNFYAKRLQKVEQESADFESKLYSRINERLTNIRTIKAFGQERQETLSFSKLVKRRYQIGVKNRLLEIFQAFTNSITIQLWSVFLMWYLGYQVVQGTLTIGEIVALLLYLEMLADPIQSFAQLFTNWKISLVSMQRLDEIFDAPKENHADINKQQLKVTDGKVSTKKVSFSFSKQDLVLHDIEADFAPNSMSAIVGHSGSGKSTLTNLLLRFLHPADGDIFIDGQNIQDVCLQSLRDQVGIIAQDFSLFEGSVLENILYGSKDKNKADAIEAARLAGAYDFITKLPGAFEAQIGVGGEQLSGGERQLIAIARTLLKDPKIIIFDEATSALDPESELHIQESLARLRKNKTLIVIAHRLSTIKTADKIYVLEQGNFVESGSFENLLEKKDHFYWLYWSQFGGLANFKQHLEQEFERTKRYNSRFSIAVLKLKSYHEMRKQLGIIHADHFLTEFDFMLKTMVRLGDSVAGFKEGVFLLLLPEIDEEHLQQFFSRMIHDIPVQCLKKQHTKIDQSDLLLIGSSINKKQFNNSEELMNAIIEYCQSQNENSGDYIVKQEDILT